MKSAAFTEDNTVMIVSRAGSWISRSRYTLRLPSVIVVTVPAEDFAFLGAIFPVDQPASSAFTRELVGWQPTYPELIAYFDGPTV